eukprot:9477278-Pyramimonas_sp.AAC.1
MPPRSRPSAKALEAFVVSQVVLTSPCLARIPTVFFGPAAPRDTPKNFARLWPDSSLFNGCA